MQYGVIILAAGKGTRMQSKRPKVLHEVGGKPMLAHLIDRAHDLGVSAPIVVYGYEGEQLKQAMTTHNITWVWQRQQQGTGHAVLQTLPHLCDDLTYFILVGDTPLVRSKTLLALANSAEDSGIAVLTDKRDNPFGYGRIVRDDKGFVQRIVEEKDADANTRQQKEVNSGIFAVRGALLKKLLPQIGNDNAQKEYYFTDIVALANGAGHPVVGHVVADSGEVLGCNHKAQLAELERNYQKRQAQQLMADGVTLADPARIDIRGVLRAGQDCFIDINGLFEGEVSLGDNVVVGANVTIKNATIGAGSIIKSHSVIEGARIGCNVSIGPFAHLRPQTQLADNSKIGNFVETKKACIGEGSKINHLSYVGDAEVGANVNVGAGAITCNYDGANKHKTVIGDGVFVGSNTALVAPVVVGDSATIAAGSTITKTVVADTLAIARHRQATIKNWRRPTKKK